MKNILIINAHHYHRASKGNLSKSLVKCAEFVMNRKLNVTKTISMYDKINVDEQIALHRWANIIIIQVPINWMSVPWAFKKYIDDVYTAGMDGRLCYGDGRQEKESTKNYGQGGILKETSYMLSVTLNAPSDAFNSSQGFFEGKTIDDLLFPLHMMFKMFGMKNLPTFTCFDVVKNPAYEHFIDDFTKHLEMHC